MKWKIFLSIIVILLVGINFGYYQPKIRSLEQTVSIQEAQISTQKAQIWTLESAKSKLQSEVSGLEQTVLTKEAQIWTLESEVSSLEQTVSNQEARISTQEVQISTLESAKSKLQSEVSGLEQTVLTKEAQISSLEVEKSNLQTDLSSAQAQTQVYKGQVTTLTSQLSSSQKRLSNILGITVTQGYQWDYQWQSWDWNLPIPLSVYVEYWERPRPREWATWVNMAKDAKDDFYIDQMIQKITDEALKNRFTEVQKLNFVVAFVQGLPYTVDSVTTPYNEYPRYPIETLFDRGGDCEDTSILVAALLDRLGYDVALLFLKDARHVAVGVSIPTASGTYYEYNGKKYYYLETTGDGWQIGEFPPDITNTKAYIYPLR